MVRTIMSKILPMSMAAVRPYLLLKVVVTLEVIMGRHPGDLISSFLSTSFASSSYDVLLEDVLDQRLALPTRQAVEKVVLVAKIALACLHTNPHSCPTMQQVY
uniref:non-specific serine/threonine protein kinase n=1 Tax=Quercus lobata TaxID=97700 RepID=A0A7N2MPG9_QUELO